MIDRRDHIAGLQPAVGRAAPFPNSDDREIPLGLRTASLAEHAVDDAVDLLHAHQLGGDLQHLVDGNREADPLSADADRHVNADHFAVDVQQRTAGVAGIDAGIRLDQIVVLLRSTDLDFAMQGTDDPSRHGVLVAKGIPQGDDRLAGHQIAGDATGHHRQGIVGVDLDDRQIHHGVIRHQAGDKAATIGQRDLNALHVLDHVEVCQDVAARVDEHPGAHPVDLPKRLAAARLRRFGSNEFPALDVDHRVADFFHRLDNGGPTQRRGVRRQRSENHGRADASQSSAMLLPVAPPVDVSAFFASELVSVEDRVGLRHSSGDNRRPRGPGPKRAAQKTITKRFIGLTVLPA